jgi:hypothetical protein
VSEHEHERLRDRVRARLHGEEPLEGEWDEPGSDELMDFDTLARVKQEGHLADLARERKIARRGE